MKLNKVLTQMPEKHPLQIKYPDLQKSPVVELSAEQHRQRGEQIPNEPGPKLEAWLSDLERIHTGRGASPERQAAQPQVLERIKQSYRRDYITGTDDASVMRKLRRDAQIAENEGHGMAEEIMKRVNEAVVEQTRETIQQDQERSLDAWIDYLTSDDATYPMWFRYYVFRNITKLASFDKVQGEFPKRSKGTTAPFPDINREALAYMEDSLAKHYGLKNLDPNNPESEIDPQTKELLDKEANFASLYKRCIDYAAPKTNENLDITDGEWVKFDQTNDPEEGKKLAHSLHGYGTGWCTAGEGTAQSQLAGGDFYVYYTKSEDGQYSVPRVAMRMRGRSIAEIRGIEVGQNLEGALLPIAEAKMNEVDPEGAEGYKKKAEDMRQLTEIFAKHKKGEELTKEQLWFIYEIEREIEGFGYEKDPRIWQIQKARDVNVDFPDGIIFPDTYNGDLLLYALTSAVNLTLPKSITGDLNLSGLTTATGLALPKRIGHSLNLSGLTSATGLTFPKRIGYSLDLGGLTSATGLTFPKRLGLSLDLGGLTSATGLTLPKSIGGTLYLSRLTSAEGLKLPKSLGGDLDLTSLTSAADLALPKSLEGSLSLHSLTSAEGLTLPQDVRGSLDLGGLTSAAGLVLPDTIGGNLNLSGLTSAAGLVLPDTIGGNLDLGGLTSAAGLTLPKSIGHDLRLSGLTSAEGLTLPDTITGILHLGGLTFAEKDLLKAQRPDLDIHMW